MSKVEYEVCITMIISLYLYHTMIICNAAMAMTWTKFEEVTYVKHWGNFRNHPTESGPPNLDKSPASPRNHHRPHRHCKSPRPRLCLAPAKTLVSGSTANSARKYIDHAKVLSPQHPLNISMLNVKANAGTTAVRCSLYYCTITMIQVEHDPQGK